MQKAKSASETPVRLGPALACLIVRDLVFLAKTFDDLAPESDAPACGHLYFALPGTYTSIGTHVRV